MQMGFNCLQRAAQVLALAALMVLCVASVGLAQNTNSADIRGTVTDATGAVIPAVSVTVLNMDTGVSREYVTNEAGIYDTVSIVPGKYQITFSKAGFDKVVRGPVTLQVGVVAIDAQLTVGAAQQQVVDVTGEAPMLKTETGEQAANLSNQVMNEMPNFGQTWTNFTKLLPGSTGAPSASQGAANPGTGVSVNGNMPYYANFLADGASTTLPHSANVDTSIFESVAEVQINTSSFSAQYGIGGLVFNQISKSGTNEWHGSAYEYLQNDALNARAFFDGSQKPKQRYNNFGGSVAGPVFKNKLFFYFNIDKIVNPNSSTNTYNVPTDAMKNGDFTGLTGGGAAAFGTIYDPLTGHTDASGNIVRDPFPGNRIDPTRIDPVAKAVQGYFPGANVPTSGYGNQNYRVATNSKNPFIKEFGRIDYNLNEKNRITGSITQRDNPAFYDNGLCPINCQSGDVDSYNAQVSVVSTFSPTTVNEFRFGYTKQGNWFQPQTIDKGYVEKLGLKYAVADVFPNINISQGTGSTNFLNPQSNSIYIEHSFEPSDVVTMIRGRHILHFGGEVLMYRDNSTPWGNLEAGNYGFTGAYTQSGTGAAVNGGAGYADFLLGMVQNWSARYQGMAYARQKSPQMFFQDDFKLRPNLTINLGLRYQIQGGWHEKNNNVGEFDPTVMNPVTNTLGAIWFAPNNGRSSIEKADYKIFLPRAGFAWSPKNTWTIRGGFGIYAYNWSLDTYAVNLGFGSNIGGSKNDDTFNNPVSTLSGTGAGLPFTNAARGAGDYNGQNVTGTPYNTPVARIYQYSFSVQKQLRNDLMFEAAYVGSHGQDLSFPMDTNQVDILAGATARPYSQFGNISWNTFNAKSNYNSMQLSVNKRFAQGFSFQANYTLSYMKDDQDSSGWGSRMGDVNYQNAYSPSSNYAYSNFDSRHMVKGSAVYQIPLGKGHALGQNSALDALVGGWQVSSTLVYQTGQPFTVVMDGNNNSGALVGQWYPNLVGDPTPSSQSINNWLNSSAYEAPTGFGNSPRNGVRGPGLFGMDFSMGKNFKFPHWERSNLQLRFDAQNILNHANFAQPNRNFLNSNFGVISSVTSGSTGRQLQLGARFSF